MTFPVGRWRLDGTVDVRRETRPDRIPANLHLLSPFQDVCQVIAQDVSAQEFRAAFGQLAAGDDIRVFREDEVAELRARESIAGRFRQDARSPVQALRAPTMSR
jgi:hypothetical protein